MYLASLYYKDALLAFSSFLPGRNRTNGMKLEVLVDSHRLHGPQRGVEVGPGCPSVGGLDERGERASCVGY